MGSIAVEGMKFFAHHGYYRDERITGNHFAVDVYVKTDFGTAAAKDDLDKTVNYEGIWKISKEVMSEASYLLEHVALRLHKAIAQQYPQIQHLRVRVTKYNPPLEGEVERTFVELDSDDLESAEID